MLLQRHPSFVLVVILSPCPPQNRRLDRSVRVIEKTTKQVAANLKQISTVPANAAYVYMSEQPDQIIVSMRE